MLTHDGPTCSDGDPDDPARREVVGIAGPYFVTAHAVRQFMARCPAGRGKTYEQALGAVIRGLAQHARPPVETRNGKGWQVRVRDMKGRLHFRAVVVPGEGERMAVATIYESGA